MNGKAKPYDSSLLSDMISSFEGRPEENADAKATVYTASSSESATKTAPP